LNGNKYEVKKIWLPQYTAKWIILQNQFVLTTRTMQKWQTQAEKERNAAVSRDVPRSVSIPCSGEREDPWWIGEAPQERLWKFW